MPIRFPCCQCGRLLQTPDEAIGKQARCPECGHVQPVPSQTTPESAEPGPARGQAHFSGRNGPENEPVPGLESPELGESPFGPGESPWMGESDNPFQPSAVTYSEIIPPPGADPFYARNRVQAPATTMLVLGVLGAIVYLFIVGGSVLVLFAENRGQMDQQFQMIFNVILYGICLVARTIVAIGANNMRNLRGYGWAMTAAILSVIPCGTCCCLIDMPIGIWSIVVLNDPRVKAAFR